MGAHGCVGAQGAREAQKQGKNGSFRVSQDRIWVLWPGKFPQTSRFCECVKKWCECVHMGTHRFRWVWMDAWSRTGEKTRQEDQQMSESDTFRDACTPRKKHQMRVDGHGGQTGSCGGNEGKEEECDTIYTDISNEGEKNRTTEPKNTKTSKCKRAQQADL